MTSRSRRLPGLLPAALLLASCVGRMHPRVVTTPAPDVGTRPIAQITVIGISDPWGRSVDAHLEAASAHLLAESLRIRNPELTVPHPADDRALLELAGLDAAWATLMSIWLETGVADAVLLRDMADAVGADAVLGGAIVAEEMSEGSMGEEGTGELSRPARRVTGVRLLLFDARDGQLLWEATAESVVFGSMLMPLADAVMPALQEITRRLPRLGTQSGQ